MYVFWTPEGPGAYTTKAATIEVLKPASKWDGQPEYLPIWKVPCYFPRSNRAVLLVGPYPLYRRKDVLKIRPVEKTRDIPQRCDRLATTPEFIRDMWQQFWGGTHGPARKEILIAFEEDYDQTQAINGPEQLEVDDKVWPGMAEFERVRADSSWSYSTVGERHDH
ncbi:hypothetical protein B0H17DRAFT_1148902 [Mycena rosella]|uniref:Uncharacterized protein n=1 Tax=Mycena rosella TaxID=1033263 RepID=A0AAD7C6T4_MYCRO|nr:hypothetical protein B0H17DRAFT_1148902 [Mycena rosella]